jgi:hypothetical protein
MSFYPNFKQVEPVWVKWFVAPHNYCVASWRTMRQQPVLAAGASDRREKLQRGETKTSDVEPVALATLCVAWLKQATAEASTPPLVSL